MTDVMGRIRRAGGMNYAFRTVAVRICALEVHLFIGRSETQGYFSPFCRSASRDGSETAGAEDIGQGIMIFAEGAIKSKMYAETSKGYS